VPAGPTPDDQPRDARELLLLATLALLTTVTAVVSSLGAPLVPGIAVAYRTDLASAQWVLSATLLAGAVATPVLGRLGQGRRRRTTILAALVTVTAGTVVSAVSATAAPDGLVAMVAGRALQGVGLGLTPLALAVARDALPPTRRAPAIALLSVTTIAGAGLGYPVTGLVAEHGGLAAAYWLGTGLAGLTLVMALLVVPGGRPEDTRPVDWPGGLLLSAAMVATLLAVSQGNAWGWTSLPVLLLGLLGPLGLAWWAVLSLRRPHPLVDLRLAVRPGVVAPNLVGLVGGLGMYFMLTLVMVLAQSRTPDGWGLGQSVGVAAMVLVPYSVASVVGSRVALAVGRVSQRALLPIGCGLFLAASVTLALVHDQVWLALACMALGGLGSGFTFSSIPVLMLPHVPRGETASALALNQVLRYLGMSVGSSVSVVLMVVLGDADGANAEGYRNALLLVAGVWALVGIAAWRLGRPAPPSLRSPDS
jgi:MFS family permease